MDLYKIICPYCKHEQLPFGYETEGYGAVVCDECGQPYVNQTTSTTVYHSFALVGIGQQEEPASPSKEEVQEAEQELEEQITLVAEVPKEELLKQTAPWQPTPGHKNGMYRIDGEYVEVRYLSSHPIRTTLADIHMLCEESNPTEAIHSLLGTAQDTWNTAALNFFIRAVKKGKVIL